jgi:hypothetical protein
MTMSAIDDVRKVIQDLVAPELKSLHVELKRVDETSKLRDEALSDKMDIKFEALSDRMDLKFDLVMTRMEAIQASLLIDKRLEAIERKTAEPMHAT